MRVAGKWFKNQGPSRAENFGGHLVSCWIPIVLPRWKSVALRDVSFEDLQVWISGLSENGSSRFEGKGLSASRVLQAHQLVGAGARFAVKAGHLAANPAKDVEDLPDRPVLTQRYLTHEQLHRLALGSGEVPQPSSGAGLLRAAVRRGDRTARSAT